MKRNSRNERKPEEEEEEEEELVPPDGGWGWIVLLGSFLTMVVGGLPIFGFSILFSPLLVSFKSSSTKIAWIFNTYGIGWSFFVLFVGPLIEEFGWRKVSIIGAVLNFLSVFLSSFAPTPDFLFFSFSLIGGIGNAICLTSTLIVVSRYFEKHRGLVIGITSVGGCISAFIGPIVANYLLENYDYTGASLIYAGIVLHQLVGCSLFQPVEWHMKPAKIKAVPQNDTEECHIMEQVSNNKEISAEKSDLLESSRRPSKVSVYSAGSLDQTSLDVSFLRIKSAPDKIKNEKVNLGYCFLCKKILLSTYQNLKTLRYTRVIIIALACGFYLLSYINFQMWIPFVVKSADYSLEMAAWCSSAASLANMTGRISASVLSDRKFFNIIYGYMFGTLCTGISVIAFSFAHEYKFFLISACFWGFSIGVTMSLNSTVMIFIMGVDNFPAVFAISCIANGIFGFVFGPLIGAIRDATATYTHAIRLFGGFVIISFLLWTLMPLAKRHDEKKEAKSLSKSVKI